ncbi:aspartic peptidase domain-containing protein, partial [Zopfochytrium polystomum]
FAGQFGSGQVIGEIFTGPVTFAGLTANTSFGVSTKEYNFVTPNVDGIIGLAFSAANNIDGGSWLDAVNLAPEQNIFAFYLPHAEDGDGGLFTIGGFDETKFQGNVTWVPLVRERFWEFDFTGSYYANGQSGTLGGVAIADTGISLIVLPSLTAETINNAVGATYDKNTGLYAIGCDKIGKAASITLTFGGRAFEIPSSRCEYFAQLTNPHHKRRQQLLLHPVAGGADNSRSPCVLGDVFLQVYYSIYDRTNKRVGFATAVHPSGTGQSGPSLPPAPVYNVTGSAFVDQFFTHRGGPVIGSIEVMPLFYGESQRRG